MLLARRSRRAARSRTALGTRAPAARRRPLRVLLIALGLLIAQGPILLHLLLVQHVTCEHGELVEVRRPRVSSRHAGHRIAKRSDAPTLTEGTADRPGHDHCDVVAMRHRIPDVAPPVAAASLVWVELATIDGARAEQRAVPILSLAPKGSPPAA